MKFQLLIKSAILALLMLMIAGQASAQKSSTRYVASSVIPVKSHEVKLFNNLYSQVQGGNRNSFYTTLVNYLYGAGPRLNIGFDARVRSVSFGPEAEGIFNVFGGSQANRGGFTAWGPKIRWAPVNNWDNFSIQSALTFGLGDSNKGQNGDLFIDWDGASWFTQVFNDFTLSDAFSLYTEVGFIWEDIGGETDGFANQQSIPIKSILQYFLNKDWTVYASGEFTPFIGQDGDNFLQYGVGTKYRFTNSFEVELLFTDFNRKSLSDIGGTAATYNIGIRYSIF